MPRSNQIPLKLYPFARLLIALCTGIVIENYFKIPVHFIIIFACTTILLTLLFSILPLSKKFILDWLRGLLLLLLFCSAGMFFTFNQNITNNVNWYGKHAAEHNIMLLTIQEPLVEKSNSFKALAEVSAVYNNGSWAATKGKVLLYFKKDQVKPAVEYGSQVIIHKPVLPVQNSGNPAAFNYERYCLFQGITGQVFVSTGDYCMLKTQHKNALQSFLFSVRNWALQSLQRNIPSKNESGIAEALLIGYRNDLDKEIVQAYSNTGVVHIIAISGLHIAMIYAGLLKFMALFKPSKIKRWAEPVFVLIVIWLFTLIAGAAPSVLRAAVMFTFILVGKLIGKNANVYNMLAASAFVLLLINPFFLWDAGFQLSYSAVFGIVLLFKTIRNLLYFKNKFLRWVWDMCAISLSAQAFTLPLVIFHFHQLPILFLLSNIVVVPLSALVLIAELILLAVSWLPAIAVFVGKVTTILIWLMNTFIARIDKLPFSVWEGLHTSLWQLLLLLTATVFICFWIFTKNTKNVIGLIVCLLLFFIIRDVDLLQHKAQQKLIVYNVSKQKAIDFIKGSSYAFSGDSIIIHDASLKNFSLKPSRIKNRIYTSEEILLPDFANHIIQFNSLKILVLDEKIFTGNPSKKIKLDVLILSKNISIVPAEINRFFDCNYLVADASIPLWKSSKWKKEFEQLHLRLYSVAQEGAFILKL